MSYQVLVLMIGNEILGVGKFLASTLEEICRLGDRVMNEAGEVVEWQGRGRSSSSSSALRSRGSRTSSEPMLVHNLAVQPLF